MELSGNKRGAIWGHTGVDELAYTVQIVETLKCLAGDLLAEWEGDTPMLVLGLLDKLQEVHTQGFEAG